MARVRMLPGGLEALALSASTWRQLEAVAEDVAARVQVPSHLRVWVKRGISSTRGEAFAQVIMEGPGVLTEEFGSRSRPAKAPLRRALRGRAGGGR